MRSHDVAGSETCVETESPGDAEFAPVDHLGVAGHDPLVIPPLGLALGVEDVLSAQEQIVPFAEDVVQVEIDAGLCGGDAADDISVGENDLTGEFIVVSIGGSDLGVETSSDVLEPCTAKAIR